MWLLIVLYIAKKEKNRIDSTYRLVELRHPNSANHCILRGGLALGRLR